MNPNKGENVLDMKLENELHLIGTYIMKIIAHTSSIKAKINIERKWTKKILNDKKAEKFLNKISKAGVDENDLNLYLSISEVFYEESIEFIGRLEDYHKKALELQESFMSIREKALNEAKGIFNETKAEIGFIENKAIELETVDKIVFKNPPKRLIALPNELFSRWGMKRNPVDFVIAHFLTEISLRTGWETRSFKMIALISNYWDG